MATHFVEDVPSVEIKDQIVYFTWPDGRKIGAPLRVCRAGIARVVDVLNAYDQGNVFDFPSPKRPRKPRGAGG